MAKSELTDEEWEVFLGLASRLGIDLDGLSEQTVTFTEMESAGHILGRSVATATTERLCVKKTAKALGELHSCPECDRRCKADLKERTYITSDGEIQMHEPVCHCSTCRRDFFPSALRNAD